MEDSFKNILSVVKKLQVTQVSFILSNFIKSSVIILDVYQTLILG